MNNKLYLLLKGKVFPMAVEYSNLQTYQIIDDQFVRQVNLSVCLSVSLSLRSQFHSLYMYIFSRSQ